MLAPGEAFERYTVLEVLGSGGMGRVYRARDDRLGRDVALKVLLDDDAAPPSDEARARMLREARAAAALDHPNAVSVYDVGDAERGPYIVMELVAGESLRSKIGRSEIPWSRRARWLVDIARALDAAHARGVVHRDIKPENVMIRHDGVVKVLDFGIARRSGGAVDPSAPTEASLATITTNDVRIGTPIYMAPEQIKGDPVDGRTDQFAWGVTAYELLSGRLPWRTGADALGLAASILTDTPPALSDQCRDLPAAVVGVIDRAIRKQPGDRFGSMHELVTALETALGEKPEPASTPASVPPRSVASKHPPARYSTEQVKAIFDRALRQDSTGKYGRDDLMEAAREIGVDEPTLDAAIRDLEARPSAPDRAAERREERARQARSFVRHAASYAIVNVFLYFMMGHWNRWVLFGWGIGLAFHLMNVIVPKDKDGKRTKKKKVTKPSASEAAAAKGEDASIDEGVRILVSTTARLRKQRANTSDETAEREAAAEAEAQQDEKARARPPAH